MKKKTLQYAGILPPLNIPSHPTEKKLDNHYLTNENVIYRKAYVLGIDKKKIILDAGLDDKIHLEYKQGVSKGEIVNILIKRVDGVPQYSHISDTKIPNYWGYEVYYENDLSRIMRNFPKSVFTIGTSRYGTSIDQISYPKKISDEIWLFFGSRDVGLRSFFGSINKLKSGFDLILNTFPNSHTKSIRLEEAIPISLSFLESLEKY